MGLGTSVNNLLTKAFNNQLIQGYSITVTVTLIRKTWGAYSPSSDSQTAATTTNYSIKSIVRDPTIKEMQDGVAQVGDVIFIFLSESTWEPLTIDDIISYDSITWSLNSISKKLVDGVPKIYMVVGHRVS